MIIMQQQSFKWPCASEQSRQKLCCLHKTSSKPIVKLLIQRNHQLLIYARWTDLAQPWHFLPSLRLSCIHSISLSLRHAPETIFRTYHIHTNALLFPHRPLILAHHTSNTSTAQLSSLQSDALHLASDISSLSSAFSSPYILLPSTFFLLLLPFQLDLPGSHLSLSSLLLLLCCNISLLQWLHARIQKRCTDPPSNFWRFLNKPVVFIHFIDIFMYFGWLDPPSHLGKCAVPHLRRKMAAPPPRKMSVSTHDCPFFFLRPFLLPQINRSCATIHYLEHLSISAI